MKVKTSITLDKELIRKMDSVANQYGNRSVMIEQAIRAFLEADARQKRDSRDLEILNRRADIMNDEASDVLRYQTEL